MSIDKKELERIKTEIKNSYEGGSTSVRVRNDVYSSVTEVAKKEKISIIKYVTIAVIEKIIRES